MRNCIFVQYFAEEVACGQVLSRTNFEVKCMLDKARPNDADQLEFQNDDFQLTRSERFIIQNYRAMKRTAQHAFVDISEEFALAFPGPGHSQSSASARY